MVSGLRSGSAELGWPTLFGLDWPKTSMSGISKSAARCGAAYEKIGHFKIDSMDISDARRRTSADGGASSGGTTFGVPELFWTLALTAEGGRQVTGPVARLSCDPEVSMCSWS